MNAASILRISGSSSTINTLPGAPSLPVISVRSAIKSRAASSVRPKAAYLVNFDRFVSCFCTMTVDPTRISYADFDRLDIRVGRVVAVDDFPAARKPAYKLQIDFGPAIGVKKSSAQAT